VVGIDVAAACDGIGLFDSERSCGTMLTFCILFAGIVNEESSRGGSFGVLNIRAESPTY
jgi:hypothetical protein